MQDLSAQVAATGWYHTLELAPGLVTDGMFDLRPWVGRYGLPDRLDGLRVLDVGSWDGFWAFEAERRGAAEVVALDLDDERELDWPPRRRPAEDAFPPGPRGAGFALAHAALGSRVARVVCNLYDADPADLGTFDLVFCGMVLIHLRDQLLALERIARLCRGTFISAEEPSRLLDRLPFPASRYLADRDAAVVYWMPNRRGWRAMLRSAGFDRVREHATFTVPSRRGFAVRHVVHHASGSVLAGQPVPRPRRVTETRPVPVLGDRGDRGSPPSPPPD
ncbi:bifunctional 2-polyprenyl-6-hydroxyphenol methylase/3-demethylubiquinol 3-O-methyltransferase UbiG [Conexibacter sp. DBS9H8]|uniref:class I SAM-dependent methyltransferase n=1 Tax=Conexibacter sp. DBS9H8 TaxID=2937801 RepID=UPI00200E9776|nr:class I SAM-dependent methyltransferase [Conexibacter sp. DBS9H8]